MDSGIAMVAAFLGLILFGLPISFSSFLAVVLYIFLQGKLPGILVPQRMFVTIDSYPLLAIPLFMLAGELMNSGGITKRIVNFSSKLVGHITGGLAHITILASMIFAGMSGSCAAAGASVGSMLIPALKRDGYAPDFAVAVTASAAVMGPVIPPSIIMVLYAACTGTSVGKMFLGGVIPGIVLGLFLMCVAYIISRKRGYKPQLEHRPPVREVFGAFVSSFPALMLPVIIVGGIFGGFFTATEAGVIGVVYATIVGFCTRELKIHMIKGIFLNASKVTANLLFLMGGGALLGWVLTSLQAPQFMTRELLGITTDPTMLILIMVGFVLFLGCFMVDVSIIPILAPLMLPVIIQAGIDPIQFGVVICITAVTGNLTPPVGGLLFVTSAIGQVPVMKTSKAVLPFLAAIIVVIVLCALMPSLVTFLPNLLM
jgi:TRAP transporter, DctM subunit